MTESRDEKRTLHALRKHIDDLLASGAVITGRDPLMLSQAGQTLRVKYGMLVSYYEFPDSVESIAKHEWPGPLRQMAADICLRQLAQALNATGDGIMANAVHGRANKR